MVDAVPRAHHGRTARRGLPDGIVTEGHSDLAARTRRSLFVLVSMFAISAGPGGAAVAAKPGKASTHAARPAPPPLPDNGLGPKDVYLEADQLIDDQDNKVITAVGHAEARYQGRIIRARKIVYDANTGASHASGDVVIINPDQTQQFAQEMDLDDEMNTGVALAFSARLENNVTIAAGAAIRRNENVLELNQGVLTPCKTCRADGSNKTPTFSIQASRILQDHQRQVVYYRNAIIRVLGVPVFYAPIFWHPDPAAERRSGLLTPRISINNKRGVSYEQPFLWVLSPSSDLTISPQINTTVNPFLNLHYRQRFYSGSVDIRAGYSYERKFDNNIKYGDASSRSYILGTGEFDISKTWKWGFGVERVSDPTLFNRYNIREVYTDRGPYGADTARLLSQIYTQREDDHSFLSVTAASFQSLRAVGSTTVTVNGKALTVNGAPYYTPAFENQTTFPTVVPLIEGRFDRWLLGGRLELTGSAVSLQRSELDTAVAGLASLNPVVAVVDPTGVQQSGPVAAGSALASTTSLTGLSYSSSTRASLNANWRRTFILPVGLRMDPFVEGRIDTYAIDNARLIRVATDGSQTDLGAAKANSDRSLLTAGADFSYPLIRPIGQTGSIILEPLAQIAVSPKAKLDPNIPNEDSTAFEFDESNLFSVNRFPGFDLYEGGGRLNLAGRATVNLDGGRRATILVGRAYHTDVQPLFSPTSGLRNTASDWITYVSVQPMPNLLLFNRSRLDRNTLSVQRNEVGVNASFGSVSGSFRYDYNTSGLTYVASGVAPNLVYRSLIGRVEDISAAGTVSLTRNIGIEVNATRDMRTRVFPRAEIGVFYQDDCIRVDWLYHHNEVYRGLGAKVGASDGIGIRLSIVTFGDTSAIGTRRNDNR